MSVALYKKTVLSSNILLIDGLGRAGKQLVAKLVSNFERVESFQYSPSFEQFPILHFLGLVDRDTTVSFLRTLVDEFVYDRMVGRSLNMRPSDASCIAKANDYDAYLRRSIDPDGHAAIDKFNEQRRIPCFMTHNLLAYFDVFLEAFPEARLVHGVRHPVDLAHSWHLRGWGTRVGTDPRAFALAIAMQGEEGEDSQPAPWWIGDAAEEYASMGSMERVVNDVLTLQTLYDQAYGRLRPDQQDQVLYVAYENLFTDSETEMDRAAAFIDTDLAANFGAVLARERVPRPGEVSIDARRKKLQDIEQACRPDFLGRLMDASLAYEQRWDLPSVAG